MHTSDLQDDDKSALKAALRCLLPVASLAVLLLLCFWMPDSAGQVFSTIEEFIGSSLRMLGHWFVIALNATIYPIAAVAILGFLWNACALNHLKSKGMTGRLYSKLKKSFLCCSSSLIFIAFLFGVSIVNRTPVITLAEFEAIFWPSIVTIVIFVIVFCYTCVNNEIKD
jgi:hypothetical protein